MKFHRYILVSLLSIAVLSKTACANHNNNQESDGLIPTVGVETDFSPLIPTFAPSITGNDAKSSSYFDNTSWDIEPLPTPVKVYDTTTGFVDESISISETLLLDTLDFSVTATHLEYTNESILLHLSLTNHSDRTLNFSSISGTDCQNSINGYMMNGEGFNIEVASGASVSTAALFSMRDFYFLGISQISDIRLYMRVSDEADTELYNGIRQLNTSLTAAEDSLSNTYFESAYNGLFELYNGGSLFYFSDFLLYNQAGITLRSEGIFSDDDNINHLFLEVHNDSSDTIFAVTSNVSLNGTAFEQAATNYLPITPNSTQVIKIAFSPLPAGQENLSPFDIKDISVSFGIADLNKQPLAEPQSISITIP